MANDQHEVPEVGKIYAALAAVKEEINSTGVSKSEHNKQQNFYYRGIDGAMNAFSGPFARAKVLPTSTYEIISNTIIETRAGGSLRHVILQGVFTYLSLEDGSTITVGPFFGEATDVLDKAFTKAQSVAYRNSLFLTFSVPLGPEADPEHGGEEELGVGDTGVEPVSRQQADGPVEIDVTASQGKVLDVKLAAAGKDRAWLLETFGGVGKHNINDAMKHIERAKA